MEKPRKLSLITILKEVPDPRVDRRKLHSLSDVLSIAICALLCGADSFEDMEVFGEAKSDWFETFLELRHGIPSHDTFNRVFAAIDPEKFLECFMRWTQSLRLAIAEEIVALDGKALRRAIHAGDCPKVVVSAWAADNGLALGQLKTKDKSNEITAVPKLLRALEPGGCIQHPVGYSIWLSRRQHARNAHQSGKRAHYFLVRGRLARRDEER